MQRIFSIFIFLSFISLNYVLSQSKRSLDSLDFDNSNWNFNSTNRVYYQIGLVYCKKPVNTDYQSLAIYVPEKYLTCIAQDAGKYYCKINISGKKGNYTS